MKYSLAIKGLLLSITLISNNTEAHQYNVSDTENVQVSGYVGYTQLFSNSKISNTFTDTQKPELGLNIVYNNKNFQIFNQFRYGTTEGTALVYNFAQYTFNLADDLNLTIKGGKLRHDMGLYNTSKVNPKTRQGVFMPQGIYWDEFDEFTASGAGISAEIQFKEFKLSYTIDDPTIIDAEKLARTYTLGLLSKTDTHFGSHQILSATYSPYELPLIIKTSWALLNLGNKTTKFMETHAPAQVGKDLTSEMATLGAEYKAGDFILSAETIFVRSLTQDWIRDIGIISHGVSFTAVYQINEHLDLRFNYNKYTSALGATYYRATPWMANQEDFNAGINYHSGPWMFQIEGHSISGARVIDPIDSRNNYDDYKDWFIIGTNIVYSF